MAERSVTQPPLGPGELCKTRRVQVTVCQREVAGGDVTERFRVLWEQGRGKCRGGPRSDEWGKASPRPR